MITIGNRFRLNSKKASVTSKNVGKDDLIL